MKTAMLGALIGAGLVAVTMGVLPGGGEVFAQRTTPNWSNLPGSGLIALSETVDDKYQQLTVIDPKLRVMSIYHIDLQSGAITLRGVRNFHWDLQMLEFNGNAPLPREIQALLEQG